MKAYQIMEEIINELNDSTINSMVRKRLKRVEDFDKKFRNSSNPLQLIDKKYQLENELNRAATARDMRKVNPKFKEFLKGELAQYRTRAKGFKEASGKKGNAEMMSEALEIMEEILLEASPLEVKRRIANKFKDKIGDMYNKAVEDDKKNSEEKMSLHNKIHGEGGNTVVVMGDKIENFSDNPEIRKDQEKFNEVTDKSKKSGEKVHKLGNLKNLVDYYKNEALEVNEDIESAIEKKYGKPEYYGGRSPWQVRGEPANKSAKLIQKARDIKEKEALQAAERELYKDRPDLKDAHPAKKNYKITDYYGQIMARRNGKAPIKEAMELAEAIINEFTEADKKEAAKKVLKDRKRKYLDKHKEYKEMDRAGVADLETVYNDAVAKERYDHAKKLANEAFSLAESIIGYADNIFELDYENKQNVNTNKIRKLKKDKDGENVEVVSVADELFPYEGNAKQQFNQKVLAKINDMIEGKGSLEDLIQFVRKYSGNKKGGNEKLHEAIELMEALIGEASVGALKRAVDNNYLDRVKKYQALQKEYNAVADELEKENREDMESDKAAELKDKLDAIGKEYFKAQDKYENADYLKRANLPDSKTNANKLFNAAYKSTDKRSKDYVEAVKNGADKKNSREAKRFDKSATLEIADPVKARAEKKADEALEEALEIVMEALQDQVDKKVANREISLDKASELEKKIEDKISPEKQAEDTKELYRRMAKKLGIYPDEKSFRKAINRAKREGRWTQASYKVSKDGKAFLPPDPFPERAPQTENKVFPSRNKIGEALEEIKQVVEGLFIKDGRGDLLNDIDNALGSPVKKTAKDMVKQCTGCKQKKVK